jgi:hypothetical protein
MQTASLTRSGLEHRLKQHIKISMGNGATYIYVMPALEDGDERLVRLPSSYWDFEYLLWRVLLLGLGTAAA